MYVAVKIVLEGMALWVSLDTRDSNMNNDRWYNICTEQLIATRTAKQLAEVTTHLINEGRSSAVSQTKDVFVGGIYNMQIRLCFCEYLEQLLWLWMWKHKVQYYYYLILVDYITIYILCRNVL